MRIGSKVFFHRLKYVLYLPIVRKHDIFVRMTNHIRTYSTIIVSMFLSVSKELLLFQQPPTGEYEYINVQMFVKCSTAAASSSNDEAPSDPGETMSGCGAEQTTETDDGKLTLAYNADTGNKLRPPKKSSGGRRAGGSSADDDRTSLLIFDGRQGLPPVAAPSLPEESLPPPPDMVEQPNGGGDDDDELEDEDESDSGDYEKIKEGGAPVGSISEIDNRDYPDRRQPDTTSPPVLPPRSATSARKPSTMTRGHPSRAAPSLPPPSSSTADAVPSLDDNPSAVPPQPLPQTTSGRPRQHKFETSKTTTQAPKPPPRQIAMSAFKFSQMRSMSSTLPLHPSQNLRSYMLSSTSLSSSESSSPSSPSSSPPNVPPFRPLPATPQSDPPPLPPFGRPLPAHPSHRRRDDRCPAPPTATAPQSQRSFDGASTGERRHRRRQQQQQPPEVEHIDRRLRNMTLQPGQVLQRKCPQVPQPYNMAATTADYLSAYAVSSRGGGRSGSQPPPHASVGGVGGRKPLPARPQQRVIGKVNPSCSPPLSTSSSQSRGGDVENRPVPPPPPPSQNVAVYEEAIVNSGCSPPLPTRPTPEEPPALVGRVTPLPPPKPLVKQKPSWPSSPPPDPPKPKRFDALACCDKKEKTRKDFYSKPLPMISGQTVSIEANVPAVTRNRWDDDENNNKNKNARPVPTSPPSNCGWNEAEDVPVDADVAQFNVDEVVRCVQLLNLSDKLADSLREATVDGALLMALDENILVQDFGCREFEAKKLMMFCKGWRPKRR